MVEVVVEYDYIAQEPDELTIKKGDIIADVVKKQGGWWEGTLGEKRGLFPDNFVRQIDKDTAVTLRSRKEVSRIRQCRAVFSYTPFHEDELKLNVGDVIIVIGEEEEGWWRGMLNGKEGVFPSNFVENIVVSPPKPTSREEALSLAGEADSPPPKLPSKPAKQLCEAKFPYKAQNEDELTLKEGDIITVLSKDDQDPGWWRGELNGHVGLFPDNFVVIISNIEEKSVNRDEKKTFKPTTDTGAIKTASVASQRKSLEVKNELKSERNTATDLPSNRTTPPVPGKKPIISLKKSPSSSGSGLLSEIKKKLVDVVDGATSSKISPPKPEVPDLIKDNSIEAFDQVERRPLLTDVRATRAKAPGRRLPTTNLHKDEDQPNVPNGNVEHLIETSEPPQNENMAPTEDGDVEKPRLREWEKHKAPWLEEMKLNQAKRTSTSPGPSPEGRVKLTPTSDNKNDDKEEKVSPVEKDKEGMNMSKSLPPLDLSKSLSVNNRVKTPEPEKIPSIKTKPTLTTYTKQNAAPNIVKESSSTSNYRHTGNSINATKEPTPTKPVAPAPPKVSPIAQLSTSPSNSKNTLISSSSALPSAPTTDTDKISGDVSDAITFKHYMELLEKINKLESIVEKQSQAIEDLKNKLQVETDMRMLLQEKVSQNVQV